MNEQVYIIIAGNKGKVVKIPFSAKKLCIISMATVIALLVLTVASICSFSLYTNNSKISNQLAGMRDKLQTTDQLIAERTRMTEEQRQKLDQKVASLEETNNRLVTTFAEEKESLISTTVEELNERSERIEKFFVSLGVQMPQISDTDSNRNGGSLIQ